MPFIKSISILTSKTRPWPYDIPGVKFAKEIDLDERITFFIGDNGCGKSTLLETLSTQLNLPRIGGFTKSRKGFEAAYSLKSELHIDWINEKTKGFFFRAEDFSQFVQSVSRASNSMSYLNNMRGEVSDRIINQMQDNNNYELHKMRKEYGVDMEGFSHGEAYMKIMQTRVEGNGIFILDEPEAALSPSRQLSLIYFIQQHSKLNKAQFIIATHSPMIMAMPNAKIYEIDNEGMNHVQLEETEHYHITKSFLDNPEVYLRHLS